MAKALQCPDCRTRHPLGDVAHLRTFRCRECRRLLKVPPSERVHPVAEQTGQTEQTGKLRAPPSSRVPRSRAGKPAAEAAGEMEDDAGAATSRVPWPMRVGVWVLAVPIGLVPVLVAGRFAGLLTMDRAIDVLIGVGWSRFVPPLLVLLVWAAASATVAHLAIEAMSRNRSRSR